MLKYLSTVKSLSKETSVNDLREIVSQLDPCNNNDLRFFFLIQAITPNFCDTGRSGYTRRRFFEKVLPSYNLQELYRKYKVDKRSIKREYIIPRRDWDLKEGVGGYKEVYNFIGRYYEKVMSQFSPSSEKLILRSCTAAKPYQYTPLELSMKDYDWAVSSYNIVPKDLNDQFPFAFYCGTDSLENTTMKERLESRLNNILNFIWRFDYKEIVDYLRPIYIAKGTTFESPLSMIDREFPGKFKIRIYNKEIVNQFDIIDYYRISEEKFQKWLEN